MPRLFRRLTIIYRKCKRVLAPIFKAVCSFGLSSSISHQIIDHDEFNFKFQRRYCVEAPGEPSPAQIRVSIMRKTLSTVVALACFGSQMVLAEPLVLNVASTFPPTMPILGDVSRKLPEKIAAITG